MSLFKKKDEKKNQELLSLKTGTKIEIRKFGDTSSEKFYNSKLEEFLSDDEILILAPIYAGKLVNLSKSNKYTIVFKSQDGIFKNDVELIEYLNRENISFIKIKLINKTDKVQRRESFRLRENMEFNFDITEEVSDDALMSDDVLTYKGKTLDISSGGIKFLSTENIEQNQYIKLVLNLGSTFIVAIAKIIFKQKEDNLSSYSYRCKFEIIHKKDVEILSKYIFDKQFEKSKKGINI